MAHRIERVAAARVEQLVGCLTLWRFQRELVLVFVLIECLLVDCHLKPSGNQNASRPSINSSTGREAVASRGSTRLRLRAWRADALKDAALTGGTSFNRVDRPGLQPTDPGSLRSRRPAHVPLDAYVLALSIRPTV